MQNDEQSIRELIATWHRATAAGELPHVLRLMAEDVVFLTSGQPPMRGREAFAVGFQLILQHHRIESSSEVEEIKVTGDWAYCWSHLRVTVTPRQGGPPKRRAGSALTILHKQSGGAWVVYRDANMLTAESPPDA